jgi:hypothetical protein
MWSAALRASAAEVAIVAGMIVAGIAIAGWPWSVLEPKSGAYPYRSQNLISALALVVLLLLSSRGLYEQTSPALASLVSSVQRSTLNARDQEQQHKGYYEKLDNSSRASAQLWELTNRKPVSWVALSSTPIYRRRRDFVGAELLPNMSITFMDQPLTTNSWGMRDRERAIEKPAGVYRIAIMGPSLVMGSGVSDAETFSRVLEANLNRSSGGTGHRFEVLNFGIAGYALTQQLALFEDRAAPFRPDSVIFTDSPKIAKPALGHLLDAVAQNIAIPYPKLRNLTQQTGISALGSKGVPVPFDGGRSLLSAAGVKTRMPWNEADYRMRASREAMLEAAFEEMSQTARKHGAVPIFLALDTVGPPPEKPPSALQHAAKAGMLVFNLFDLWVGRDLDSFRVHTSDNHANAAGSRMIADRLRELIEQHPRELRINATAENNRRIE